MSRTEFCNRLHAAVDMKNVFYRGNPFKDFFLIFKTTLKFVLEQNFFASSIILQVKCLVMSQNSH